MKYKNKHVYMVRKGTLSNRISTSAYMRYASPV